MKIRQSIMLFAVAGMVSICAVQADAEEMTETQTQKTMTKEEKEKEEKKEEAKEYLEKNGIWTSSESMTMSFYLPDSSWKVDQEGNQGYECRFVSGENRIEFQIFSGETAQIRPEEIPEDEEEMQRMVEEEIEVLEFETEVSEEQTVIRTILEFPETEEEIYRYAISFQLYQKDEYLEASAYTDDEQMIYLLLESLSSAELL